MTKKLSVGGQAVIEGVMMKGPEKMAVAVRQANGEIAVDVKPVSSIRDRYPFFKKPFLRGVVSLVESLVDGMGPGRVRTFWRRWPVRGGVRRIEFLPGSA